MECLHRLSAAVIALVCVCALTLQASAGPLIEHVPEDAVVYVGWRGAAAMGEQYERSHLATAVRDTTINQTLVELLPIAGPRLGQPGMQASELATRLDEVMWDQPWAMFMGDPAAATRGLDLSTAHAPTVRIGFICQPGEHAVLVRRALQQWERTLTDEHTPATWVTDDGYLGLLIGYNERQTRDIRTMWRSLKHDNSFRRARQRVMGDPAMLAYVDVERLLALAGEMGAMPALAGGDVQVELLLAGLGVDAVTQAVYAGDFRDRMWHAQLFVEAPAPRQGLLTLLDARPITDIELRIVPRSATWLSTYRLDPVAALAAFDGVLASLDEPATARYEQQLGHVNGQLGIDLQRDLLDGLGDLWLLYSDPAFMRPGGPGLCLVHLPRDAARVQRALATLTERANAPMHATPEPAGEAAAGDAAAQPATIAAAAEPAWADDVTVQGLKVHQVAAADGSVALAWTIAEGRLYVATSADAVAFAHAHARSPGNSILSNSRFQRVRERLGNATGPRLTFADLQLTGPSMFQMYREAMADGSTAVPARSPADAPAVTLPELRRLLPYLLPAGKAAWADEHGWHSHSIGPFPGCSLLSPDATVNLSAGSAWALQLLTSLQAATPPDAIAADGAAPAP